ncbi:MAG: hypothetical protein RRC07_16510 [Anaerolineae bacterium]|nr:hypothetical protein [Anaerolineae bacterium]
MEELQLEDAALVQALVALRSRPRIALQERVKAITETERLERAEGVQEVIGGHVLPSLSRLALRAGAVAAILFVAALLLLATVPSVRAAFGRIMQQRFGLVLVEPDAFEAPAFTEPLEDSEVHVEERVVAPLSFEEVQARVPFSIPVPQLLPDGLELWAAHMSEYPASENTGSDSAQTQAEPQVVVVLTYKPSGDAAYDPSAALTLIVTNRTGTEGGYAVAASAEESVEVNGKPAVYARGSWQRVDENEPPDPANMVWDGNADATMLSWEADGFTFTLQGYLLGLSREEYIQIAESVK